MKIPLVDLKANYLSIKEEIDDAIQSVIDDTAFIRGKYLEDFEKNFAEYLGVNYCVGTSSGTTALHLALVAAGINKNDTVLTVPNSFIATAECVSYVNGRLDFVDVKEDTGLIDIGLLEEKITKDTKALIVVHLYGQMPDMKRIKELTDEKDVILIEDAAQAHGSEWKNYKPGFYGDFACFSFFPAKNLGCYGDGGCIVTNDSVFEKKIRQLVDHGRTSKYKHDIIGFNYRLDALQAAILDVKLKHLDKWVDLRRKHAEFYNKNLKESIIRPVEAKNAKHAYYMYEIGVEKRDKLMSYLKKNGIGCSIHYPIPIHLQPAYKHLGYKKGSFSVAEKLAEKILSIPMYPELTQEQQQQVCDKINNFF